MLGLVGLVDEGDLVRRGEGVAVDAVVAGVELTTQEPGEVSPLEAAAADNVKVLGPGEEVAGQRSPEFRRVLDGLLMQPLVVFKR